MHNFSLSLALSLSQKVRRLRIQQRLRSAELGVVKEEQENELPSFPSFIPFLPPLSSENLKQYYATCFSLIAGIIIFGGLLAPTLELRLGLGGTTYEDFIRSMHLPMQLRPGKDVEFLLPRSSLPRNPSRDLRSKPAPFGALRSVTGSGSDLSGSAAESGWGSVAGSALGLLTGPGPDLGVQSGSGSIDGLGPDSIVEPGFVVPAESVSSPTARSGTGSSVGLESGLVVEPNPGCLVDPIVASFSGGAVGVISALMVVEVNNVKQQEHKRCKYCLGTGYLSCARCSSTGALVLIKPVATFNGDDQPLLPPRTERCSNCSGAGKVMCPTCLCTGMEMASEHDPRIDPFD
ncbi:hypothetical protein GIB67_027286 [Kingdonia uniflora]|uniref:Uncharacterized protein n=1 Tax=Kingdonia uniflora TaxID=39325 RepID=A0A7J7KYM3_9MAGN|nr:hypothetical protein GIB67_027286 [Kingdonia uniflora]